MDKDSSTNSENHNVSRAAGIVGFYTFLSRVLGLVRDMVVARFFGAGMVADAFFVAFRIPNLLRRLFAEGSLTIAFIPIFTEYLRLKSRKDAFDLARIILTLLSVILVLITIGGVLCSPLIVKIQAYGFSGNQEKYELAVVLTRITFPYIFLISLVAFFMGILNSLRHFAAPAAAPIFLNVGIIGGTIGISPFLSQPIIGVSIGVIIGGIMQVGLQIPWILKSGISLLPKWMPGHPAVKRIGMLMLPAVFGSAIYQVNQFIGTLLASFLAEGSISWLYYADRLVQFPLGVFAIAVSTATLPSLSKQVTQKEFDAFGDTLNHSLGLTFFIIIPSMAGLIILSEPIVSVFFERGAFDSFSSIMTAKALVYYTVGLWAFAGIRVVIAAFYALQDTKTPVYIAVVSMACYVALSLILMGPLAHGGLALSLSLSSTIQFFLLVYWLLRKSIGWNIKPVIYSILRSLAASIIMGIIICFFYFVCLKDLASVNVIYMTAYLAGIIFVGVVVYFFMAKILGCVEVSHILSMINPYTNNRTKENI